MCYSRYARTGRIITVIVLDDEGIRHGVNGWPSSSTDQRRYLEGVEL